MSQGFFDSIAEFNAQYTPEKVKEAEATVALRSLALMISGLLRVFKAYNTVSGNGVEAKADMVALMLAGTDKPPKKDFCS